MIEKKHVLTVDLPVRWRDLDNFGHVNNSIYFTYFEQARVKWWESIGFDLGIATEGPVIVTAECQFLKPVLYPSDLKIEVFVGQAGRSSYSNYYNINIADQLYATGSTKTVWINYKAGKSIPLPDFVRKFLL